MAAPSPHVAKGNFKAYPFNYGHEYPDDEEAILEAIDTMLDRCGNPGQESLIGDHLNFFADWAIQALEAEGAEGTTWDEFSLMVVQEYEGGGDINRGTFSPEAIQKFQGTDFIWAEGWTMVAEQSGYHDAHDETGEGMGMTFG